MGKQKKNIIHNKHETHKGLTTTNRNPLVEVQMPTTDFLTVIIKALSLNLQ
jgi:hypothetical protein